MINNQTSAHEIFDRQLLRWTRKRIQSQKNDHRFLIDWAENELYERLGDINRSYETAVYSCAFSPSKIMPSHKIHQLYHFDLGYQSDRPLTPSVSGDEEFFPFADEGLDLIMSNLHLHSCNDLPGVLIQMKRALKPDGLFLGALFGGQTLHELRQCLLWAEEELNGGVSPRVFPFADKQDIGGLLQRAQFNLPVIDSEILIVSYDNIFSLMKDLHGMGERNVILKREKGITRRALYFKAGQYYQDHFCNADGRIEASFEIIFMLGWAPHESQQKPLKPGSAKERLSDALKTEEVTAGEIAKP